MQLQETINMLGLYIPGCDHLGFKEVLSRYQTFQMAPVSTRLIVKCLDQFHLNVASMDFMDWTQRRDQEAFISIKQWADAS